MMNETQLRNLNADALAYLGDAVYELRIREMLLQRGDVRADRLHRHATDYVSATAQAAVIRTLYDELTADEQSMVKRWRNHKYHSKAKHADPMTYKWATAFEALIGYLYLDGEAQRLDWLFARAVEIAGGAAGTASGAASGSAAAGPGAPGASGAAGAREAPGAPGGSADR